MPTTAALRFTGVQIPKGATIVNAQVQFKAYETSSKAANLAIRAERADNSAPITTTAFNLSSRARTTASVTWVPPAWQTGAAGPAQLTPNLAPVVQEVVKRPGWAPGNALTVIVTGSGSRTARSFEGGGAPVLHIKYVAPEPGTRVSPVAIEQTAGLPGRRSLGTLRRRAGPRPTAARASRPPRPAPASRSPGSSRL